MTNKGFTLVELMVAVVAGSFVIFAALGFMRMIQTQSVSSDRSSLFTASFSGTVLSIRNELRSSPKILFVDRTSITFVDLPLRDTVNLAILNGTLCRNGKPVPLSVANGIFDKWELSEIPLGTIEKKVPVRLFDIVIGAHGDFGLQKEMKMRVMAARQAPGHQ